MDQPKEKKKKAVVGKSKAAPKKPTEHPLYVDMVNEAIKSVQDRSGFTRTKICKYIQNAYPKTGELKEVTHRVTAVLKRFFKSNVIVNVKGHGIGSSMKLAASGAKVATKAKASSKAPKRTAVSGKPSAKKETAKRSLAVPRSEAKSSVKKTKKPALPKPKTTKPSKPGTSGVVKTKASTAKSSTKSPRKPAAPKRTASTKSLRK